MFTTKVLFRDVYVFGVPVLQARALLAWPFVPRSRRLILLAQHLGAACKEACMHAAALWFGLHIHPIDITCIIQRLAVSVPAVVPHG